MRDVGGGNTRKLMAPIALWWENAPMGAVANALVIAAVVFADRLDLA